MIYNSENSKICCISAVMKGEDNKSLGTLNTFNTSETLPNSSSNNKQRRCFDMPCQITSQKRLFKNEEDKKDIASDIKKEKKILSLKKKNKSVLKFDINPNVNSDEVYIAKKSKKKEHSSSNTNNEKVSVNEYDDFYSTNINEDFKSYGTSEMQFSELESSLDRELEVNEKNNYFVNSVIEEEKSDLISESDFSNRKLSFLLSTKQRLEKAIEESLEASIKDDKTVGKNLDKLFFGKIKEEISDYQSTNAHCRCNTNDLANIQMEIEKIFNKIKNEHIEQKVKKEKEKKLNKIAVIEKFLSSKDSNTTSASKQNSDLKTESKKKSSLKKGIEVSEELKISNEINFNVLSPKIKCHLRPKSNSPRLQKKIIHHKTSTSQIIPFIINPKKKRKMDEDKMTKFLSSLSKSIISGTRPNSTKNKRANSYSNTNSKDAFSMSVKMNKEKINSNQTLFNINYTNFKFNTQKSKTIRVTTNLKRIYLMLKELEFFRKGEKEEAIGALRRQTKNSFFAVYLTKEKNCFYFLGLYLINFEKEMLFKLTTGNKFAIPIKIKFSNLINFYFVDGSFQFHKRNKLMHTEECIVFFNNNLKF